MRRGIKYGISATIMILVLFIAVNGTLFILGLTGINIAPAQTQGNDIALTLNVPNQSFIPVNGRIETSVYAATTGQLIGSGSNVFKLSPQAATPVKITVAITQTTQDRIKVTIDYFVGAYGYILPFPYSVSVTLPPPG